MSHSDDGLRRLADAFRDPAMTGEHPVQPGGGYRRGSPWRRQTEPASMDGRRFRIAAATRRRHLRGHSELSVDKTYPPFAETRAGHTSARTMSTQAAQRAATSQITNR